VLVGIYFGMTLGGFVVAAFAAIGARALHDFSRHEMKVYCRLRKRQEIFGEILDFHEHVGLGAGMLHGLAVSAYLIGGTIWLTSLGAQGQAVTGWPLAGSILAGILGLLLITIWIPRSIVHVWSAPFLFHTWRLWRFVNWFTFPLSIGANVIDTVVHRMAGRHGRRPSEEEFEDEIRTIVTEGMHDGLLEEDAREMIEGVIELGDVDVADIMTPRSRIDALDVELDWDKMLRFVIRIGRTRIPVYEEKLDNIIGILYAKDLLAEFSNGNDPANRSLRTILRDAWKIPKTKPVDDLLQEFQESRKHIAIVVDEYMSVAGLVTIEDVLEEIVGEIVDEYDADIEEQVVPIDDESAMVSARAHVDEVNERLGVSLPDEEEYDTVGGFVAMRLGRIPAVDDIVNWQNLRFTVVEASRRGALRLRLDVLADQQRDIA